MHNGKYATKKTVEKFSKELGFSVSEVTVRNCKRAVAHQLEDGKYIDSICQQKRGRPLLLSEEVKTYQRSSFRTYIPVDHL